MLEAVRQAKTNAKLPKRAVKVSEALSTYVCGSRIVADRGAYAALVVLRVPGCRFHKRAQLAFAELRNRALSRRFDCHVAMLAARSAGHAGEIVPRLCRR
jgi:hypothetical protein